MRHILAGLLMISSIVSVQALAGPIKGEPFKVIHTSELDKWMTEKKEVHIFDANTEKTRTTDGVIPGATTLTSSTSYEVAKVLPASKDANLVFYCANTACMASHEAAKRATEAGYKNVSVLADGIQGWKSAGKPTEKYKKM